MSDTQDKKYDVAISLRWTDVDHARSLYERLRDRLEVFFADERQEDFVGTDGEESFGHIFRDQARIVVVLYRPDWGTTPFTRAEEAAIKQRAWTEGYGFSVWVPIDTKEVPPYIPPQHVWFDFERYGIDGLASVIEERVRDSGIKLRPPSPIDELKRLRRERDAERERRAFVGSQAAADYFHGQVAQLEALAAEQAERLSEIDSDLRFKVERHRTGRGVHIFAYRHQADLTFSQKWSNSSEGSFLRWILWKREHDRAPYPELVRVSSEDHSVDLNSTGEPVWRDSSGREASTTSIVESAISKLALREAQRMNQV